MKGWYILRNLNLVFKEQCFNLSSCFAFFSSSNIVAMITNSSLVGELTNSTSNSHLKDQGLNLLLLLELESEYIQNSLQSWNASSMKSNTNKIYLFFVDSMRLIPFCKNYN